jgi:site-specific DNA-methyltransferase (adenine-specific)
MVTEAVSAGFYQSDFTLGGATKVQRFPRIQILTIEELLAGKHLQYPRHKVATFKQAPRQFKSKAEQGGLF